MKILPAHLALAALCALLTGCVSVVPYTARPERIRDPKKEILEIIAATPQNQCVTSPDINDSMLVLQYACSSGAAGNESVRFDKVQTVEIVHGFGKYGVKVTHTAGIEDFEFASGNLDDIQRLADAISALVAHRAAPSVPAKKPDAT